MFFAAYSISNAEANSAAANSFKTKQHLSGSNFLIFVFGIKNILFTFIFFFYLKSIVMQNLKIVYLLYHMVGMIFMFIYLKIHHSV